MKQKQARSSEAMRTRLKELRQARGLTAADLASKCGVRRQTIYAIEDGIYIPNTLIAVALARALDSSVEEIFSIEQAGPCHTVEAELAFNTRKPGLESQLVQIFEREKRLFAVPAQPNSSFLPHVDGVIQRRSGRRVSIKLNAGSRNGRPSVIIAGCDPALSILEEQAEAAGLRIGLISCGSRKALELLRRGTVDIAGSHLFDAASGEYNVPIVKRTFEHGATGIVHFASWQAGMLTRKNVRKFPRAVADLGTADFQIVNREPGSGSRALLDESLRRAHIQAKRVPGYSRVVSGHMAAAFAVASGHADACVATSSVARCYALNFVPLRQERFDLVFLRTFADSAAGKRLLDTLNKLELRRQLGELAGYETAETGKQLL
ncbi:MAG: helix-turn-helix domain-containing protein [Acidobacteriaceae bacterium]|nr:helix-turn-helix domain-containing protein [Acidobacteriaceae bacterium]